MAVKKVKKEDKVFDAKDTIVYPLVDDFISQTIKFETGGDKTGAYTNDPRDAGGETKWGISAKAHPALKIKSLTYKEAVDIYKKEYYNMLFDFIGDKALAFKLFDMSVLMGPDAATKCLQKALIDCGSKLNVDGKFGPLTLTAVNLHIADTNRNLYDMYRLRLMDRVIWLTIKNPLNLRFITGWKKRINFKYGEVNG